MSIPSGPDQRSRGRSSSLDPSLCSGQIDAGERGDQRRLPVVDVTSGAGRRRCSRCGGRTGIPVGWLTRTRADDEERDRDQHAIHRPRICRSRAAERRPVLVPFHLRRGSLDLDASPVPELRAVTVERAGGRTEPLGVPSFIAATRRCPRGTPWSDDARVRPAASTPPLVCDDATRLLLDVAADDLTRGGRVRLTRAEADRPRRSPGCTDPSPGVPVVVMLRSSCPCHLRFQCRDDGAREHLIISGRPRADRVRLAHPRAADHRRSCTRSRATSVAALPVSATAVRLHLLRKEPPPTVDSSRPPTLAACPPSRSRPPRALRERSRRAAIIRQTGSSSSACHRGTARARDERGEGDLSGRSARMTDARAATPPARAPDDDARLRTAEQLVAAERDEIRTGFHRFRDGLLAGQAVARRIEEGPAAEIVDERDPSLLRDGRERAVFRPRDETDHLEVARVHAKDGAGLRRDRGRVVLDVGPSSCPPRQLRAGTAQHVGIGIRLRSHELPRATGPARSAAARKQPAAALC